MPVIYGFDNWRKYSVSSHGEAAKDVPVRCSSLEFLLEHSSNNAAGRVIGELQQHYQKYRLNYFSPDIYIMYFLRRTNDSVTEEVEYIGGRNGWMVQGAFFPGKDRIKILKWLNPLEKMKVKAHEFHHRRRHFFRLPQYEWLVEEDTAKEMMCDPEYQGLRNDFRNVA